MNPPGRAHGFPLAIATIGDRGVLGTLYFPAVHEVHEVAVRVRLQVTARSIQIVQFQSRMYPGTSAERLVLCHAIRFALRRFGRRGPRPGLVQLLAHGSAGAQTTTNDELIEYYTRTFGLRQDQPGIPVMSAPVADVLAHCGGTA